MSSSTVSASAAMREPVLVVDLGTTTSSAILLADGDRRLLKEPGTGLDWWPTAVYEDNGRLLVGSAAEARRVDCPSAYRTEFKPDIGSDIPILLGGADYSPEDLVVAVLSAFRAEATTFGAAPARLLVTVPVGTDGKRRDAMLSAGNRAGFTDVELLPEPVAAAFAPTTRMRWSSKDIVLVYDLGGGTFDAAVIRVGQHAHEILKTGGLVDGHGGRDVDAAIVRDLQPAADAWIQAAPERGKQRDLLAQQTLITATELKRRLTATETATNHISLEIPAQRIDRKRLAQITEPLLARTVDCCRLLIAAANLDITDVTGVLLVGGSTQMPVVKPYLERQLARPIYSAADPVLAVVEGATRWADTIPSRYGVCEPPSDLFQPLRWTLPGSGRATLVRWFVEPGDAFPAGAALARVRLADNTLYDLRARIGGQATCCHVRPGEPLYSGTWIVTTLHPPAPDDLLHKPLMVRRWPGQATAMAYSPQGRWLAIASRDVGESSTLRVVDPASDAELSHHVVPGRIHALAWSPDGTQLAYGLSGDDQDAQIINLIDDPGSPGATSRLLATQPGAVLDMAYLPGGQRIAIACGAGFLQVIDACTGRTQLTKKLTGRPGTMALHPDGRSVALGGGDSQQGTVHLVDIGNHETVNSLTQPARVRSLALSPDGRWLAVAGGTDDGPGFLAGYDTEASWLEPRWFASHQGDVPAAWESGSVRAVDISCDGALLVAVTANGQVWIGETRGGGAVCALHYNGLPVAVAFSPDGQLLSVAGTDGVGQWALTGAYATYGQSDQPPVDVGDWSEVHPVEQGSGNHGT